MAYVGTPIDTTNQFQSLQGKRFSGDASTTAFTLDIAPSSVFDIEVFVENVRQDPNSAYSLSGTTLTFTGAPPSGTNNIYVVHQAKAVGTIEVPASNSGDTTFNGTITMNGGVVLNEESADVDFRVESNGNANMIKVDGGNDRVGIGLASPLSEFHVDAAAGAATEARVSAGTVYTKVISDDASGFSAIDYSHDLRFKDAGTEKVRIDSSGTVLVGKTSADSGGSVGTELLSGRMFLRRSGGAALIADRDTSDGDVLLLRRAGTNVGIFGGVGTELFLGSNSGSGSYLNFGSNRIIPASNTGGNRDDVIDLGNSSSRFDDIHATNGTIQTSDETEKQSIQSLTSTEIAVAKKISKLFKTFKFNSAVEKKGDSARTHTGIIAQDVQQAFSDEGLDSGDYGMFISSTWWEKEISVDAVAEELDEEGNVLVESKDAYTYIDTKEEETEGYTKKTRLGIRYPELLSFVSSAFEQRLTDIETRVTALEE
jgi:hypothetical protein